MDGYTLTFNGLKAASVTTSGRDDGTCEFYIHTLGASGNQRHLHGYARLSGDSLLIFGGARVKEDQFTHLGPGVVVGHSTQEVARLVVETKDGGQGCTIKQQLDGEWLETSPSTMGGRIRRPEVELPIAGNAEGAEYSIAMYDHGSMTPGSTASRSVLPFSSDVPFGFTVDLIREW